MRLDISASEFAKMSGEGKKKYIAGLFVSRSGGKPVDDSISPVAIVTAGLPGAGKTEFLDTLAEGVADLGYNMPVRIDLDEIISVLPGYTPKDYYKLRNQGNLILERTIDIARRGRYNMFIDGTFSSKSGASIGTIGRLLDAGYRVRLVYIYDKIETAWMYTQKRQAETGRAVDLGGFKKSSVSMLANLRDAKQRFSDSKMFKMSLVVQNELRDRDFNIMTDSHEIDKQLELKYNTSKLKDTND